MADKKSSAIDRTNVVAKKRQQVIGIGAFTVIVLLVLVVGAIRPSIATIIRVRAEIKQKETILTTLKNKQIVLNGLDAQYQGSQELFDNLPLIYPNSGDYSLFMANIEDVAKSNGYELVSISFDNSDISSEGLSTTVLMPQQVSVVVKGEIRPLIQLLTSLEEMPMYPVVRAVSYGTEPDEDGDIRISVTLMIYGIQDEQFYE